MMSQVTRLTDVLKNEGPLGVVRAAGRKLSKWGEPATEPSPSPPVPRIPRVRSAYCEWLGYANSGMMVRGNIDAFDFALRHLNSDAPIIEIGSFCGLSTNLIGHFKELHGRTNRLITCDRWQFENVEANGMCGESQSVTHAAYREFVKESFLRNIRFFSRNDPPFTLELWSDEFFAAWRQGTEAQDVLGRAVQLGGPISFAFIDGNHTYDFAKRDFENADQFLEVDGFVLFDDSGPKDFPGVHRAVLEVIAGGRYEVLAANPNYLLRKRATANS